MINARSDLLFDIEVNISSESDFLCSNFMQKSYDISVGIISSEKYRL